MEGKEEIRSSRVYFPLIFSCIEIEEEEEEEEKEEKEEEKEEEEEEKED